MKNIIIAVIVIAVAAVAWFVFMGSTVAPVSTDSKTERPVQETAVDAAHIVTLTKDGYTPDRLTVKKGETVKFVSTAGKLFWPASNLHPSHALYSAFDPKEPIQADESWSFTFDVVGTHPFHDHLAPYYTGVITVTE
jgi:plastocyanin